MSSIVPTASGIAHPAQHAKLGHVQGVGLWDVSKRLYVLQLYNA